MIKRLLLVGAATALLLSSSMKVRADDLPPLLLPLYLPQIVKELPEFPPCECIPGKPCVC